MDEYINAANYIIANSIPPKHENFELKPCPFCGGAAEFWRENESIGHGSIAPLCYVKCSKCEARTKSYDKIRHGDNAEYLSTKAWNKRIKEID